jgi:hypothetical protein
MEEVRGRLASSIRAGMSHLILSLPAPYPDGIVHRLDEEIIQPLKAEFAALGTSIEGGGCACQSDRCLATQQLAAHPQRHWQ